MTLLHDGIDTRNYEYFAPVEIDHNPAHPDIVFLQHRATLATLAIAADGSLPWLGYHGGKNGLPLDEVPELEDAARAYRARMVARSGY